MNSFFNIAKIDALLSSTVDGDKIALSMCSPDNKHSIADAIKKACRAVDINTNTQLVRAIAEGMGNYLREYPAPPSYKQRLWDSCDKWIQRIAGKLGVEDTHCFEDEIARPVERDLGIDLIKALHDEEGKTKAVLAQELNIGEKTIQTALRALDPALRKGGNDIRPLRIAGQEMHPSIQYRHQTSKDNPRAVERVFYMENRLHPIALQLNTQELGTLLQSLYRMYDEAASNLSNEIALDIWCQLTAYAQDRIVETFGSRDPGFADFIDMLKAELAEGQLVTFQAAEQQTDIMSMKDLLMYTFKDAVICGLVVRRDGGRLHLDKVRIVPSEADPDAWFAVPPDEYPDLTNAISFTTEDVLSIK